MLKLILVVLGLGPGHMGAVSVARGSPLCRRGGENVVQVGTLADQIGIGISDGRAGTLPFVVQRRGGMSGAGGGRPPTGRESGRRGKGGEGGVRIIS